MSRKKSRSFKQHCHLILHRNKTPLAHFINGFISFLIVMSVAVIPVRFIPGTEWLEPGMFFFDRFAVTIFTLEYVLRMWSAVNPWKYVFSWWGFVDLIAILPFYLNRIGLIDSFVIFLSFRVLRVLKFSRMYGIEDVQEDLNRTKGQKHGGFVKMENEVVQAIVQQHPVIFLLRIMVPLVLTSFGLTVALVFQGATWAMVMAIAFFVLSGFFYFKAWLDYNYDVIIVTTHRVIVQDREIFGWRANDISYQAITNIFPDTMGAMNWILGAGHVVIETAAMKGTLSFKFAQRPNEIVALISKNRQKFLGTLRVDAIPPVPAVE